MLNDGIYIQKFKKELGYFTKKEYRRLSNEIVYYYETYGTIDIASFISYITPKDNLNEDIMNIIKNVKIKDLKLADFMDYISVCLKEMQKEQIKNLKEEIASELDEAKKMELVQKLIEIKKGCVENE